MTASENYLWNELIDRCLEFKAQNGLADKSCADLQRILKFFEIFCKKHEIYGLPVDLAFLKDFVAWRSEKRSCSTAKLAVWAVKNLFGFLYMKGLCREDVSAGLRYPKYRPREKIPTYLQDDQLKAVLEGSFKEDTIGDFVIVSLMASTGLRPGDMEGISRFNFHEDEQMLTGTVKGKASKRTYLSNSCTNIIGYYLETRTDSCESLLLNTRKKPATKAYIQRVIKRAGERAELPFSLTCNIMRHTFATNSARRHGRAMTRVLMGHAKIATTEVYTHLCPEVFKPLMNSHPYNDPEISL